MTRIVARLISSLLVSAMTFALAGPAAAQSEAEVREATEAIEQRWSELAERSELERWAPEAYAEAREAAERAIRTHWSVEKDEHAARNYRAERLMDRLEVIARGNVLAAQVEQLEARRDQLQALLDEREAQRAAALAAAAERQRIAEEQKQLADAISAEAQERERQAEEERSLAEARARLAEEERLRALERQKVAEQEARLAEASRKAAELAAELERRNAEIARLEAAVATRQAADATSRAESLEALLNDTRSALELEQSRRGAVFVLGDVLFETDGAELLPGAHAQLDELIALLQDHPEIDARVEGHTDSTGSTDYNLDLSERRARSVADYLANHGVDGGRLSSAGLGEAFPVAGNDTPTGRQRNRRVEVIMNSGSDGK